MEKGVDFLEHVMEKGVDFPENTDVNMLCGVDPVLTNKGDGERC